MKVAVISANLGSFDVPVQHVEQTYPCDFHHFTDENFPPRLCMNSRLQSRIVKMFGWEMVPGYDAYIWMDCSCAMTHPDCVKWFVEQLGDADIALFKHPHRNTIKEEADYLKERLAKGCPYITPRYKNELIDEQLEACHHGRFRDDQLFASTAMIYRDNLQVIEAMRLWWLHTSRYHCIDQLSLPFAMQVADVDVNVINENYLKNSFFSYVRPHGHK